MASITRKITSLEPVISAALNRVDGPHTISDRPTNWMPMPCPPKQEGG